MSDKTNKGSKNIYRAQCPNFTKEEQILLFACLEPFTKKNIECKKSDTVKNVDKHRAWVEVADVFNANTKHGPRTVENLLSCYRNNKSKLKKQHSAAKMMLKDEKQKEALINALDENGKNWNVISSTVNRPIEICQEGFEELKKELVKEDSKIKKKMNGTGGGPCPSESSLDNPINKFKKLIEPQIDGLFTIYDGDAMLMSQYQESIPEEERVEPIEANLNVSILSDKEAVEDQVETSEPPKSNINIIQRGSDQVKNLMNRTDVLRKRKDSALMIDGETTPCKKRKTANESFRLLAEEKLELVRLPKDYFEMEKGLQVKILEMEMQQKIKMNELDIKLKIKEIELVELKIKNETK